MPPVVSIINKEAFGIVSICGSWRGHYTKSVIAKQLVRVLESVYVSKERRQIARCRNPTAVRIHSGDVHPVGIARDQLIIVFHFIGRSIPQHRCRCILGFKMCLWWRFNDSAKPRIRLPGFSMETCR